MEEFLKQFFSPLHGGLLALVIVVSLGVLGKAADWLVDEAVSLSERSGIPKAVIGATIVSLGTTTPEAAVSVLAAIEGSPGLALGNAVGSIICNAGLILGLACVLAPLKLDRMIVSRLGWIQLGTAVVLVGASFPWASPGTLFSAGGRLSQITGFVFLAALAVYIGQSIRWAKGETGGPSADAPEADARGAVLITVARLLGALAVVVMSARVLIPGRAGGGHPFTRTGRHYCRHTGGLRDLPAGTGNRRFSRAAGARRARGRQRCRGERSQRLVCGRGGGRGYAGGLGSRRSLFLPTLPCHAVYPSLTPGRNGGIARLVEAPFRVCFDRSLHCVYGA